MNQIILIGNLGKDPEVHQYNGKNKASFSIATTERFKGKEGEQREETTWHNVECWGYLADLVLNDLKKGSSVFIVGVQKHQQFVTQAGEKAKRSFVAALRISPLAKKDSSLVRTTKEHLDEIPF